MNAPQNYVDKMLLENVYQPDGIHQGLTPEEFLTTYDFDPEETA